MGEGEIQGNVPSALGLVPVTQAASPGRGCSCISSHCQSREDGAHSSKTGAGLISCLPFKILIVGPHGTTYPGGLPAVLQADALCVSPLTRSVPWPLSLGLLRLVSTTLAYRSSHVIGFPPAFVGDSVLKTSNSLSPVHSVLEEPSYGPARGE